MEKRYEVFVSSTYEDLKDERKAVFKALTEIGCIPAGMELFPAADEEQMTFIKRILENCDYYIIVLGGRYGSVAADGFSYTEKEYDYVKSLGMKILAFVHRDINAIQMGRSEANPEMVLKLKRFRDKVMNGKLIAQWSTQQELELQVHRSINLAIQQHPAVGWVRGDAAGNVDLLSQLNTLRDLVGVQSKIIDGYKATEVPVIEGLAGMHENFEVVFSGLLGERRVSIAWDTMFTIMAPFMQHECTRNSLNSALTAGLVPKKSAYDVMVDHISDQSFHTILIQFQALGLIVGELLHTTNNEYHWFYKLTSTGRNLMFTSRSVKTKM